MKRLVLSETSSRESYWPVLTLLLKLDRSTLSLHTMILLATRLTSHGKVRAQMRDSIFLLVLVGGAGSKSYRGNVMA